MAHRRPITIMGKEQDDGVRRNVPFGVRTKKVPTAAAIIASGDANPAAPQKTNIVYDADQCSGPLRNDDFGRPKAVLVSNVERKENHLLSRRPVSDVTGVVNTRRPKQRNAFDEDQTIAAQAQAMQKETYRY